MTTLINRAAISTATVEDIQAAWEFLKSLHGDLQRKKQREASLQFMVGQLVKFNSEKRGRTVYGRIDKFNQKTVNLTECNPDGSKKEWAGTWRVAPSFLQKV